MSKTDFKDLKNASKADLQTKLLTAQSELASARARVIGQDLKNVRLVREARVLVARISTLISQVK